jgi:hypothetical protein
MRNGYRPLALLGIAALLFDLSCGQLDAGSIAESISPAAADSANKVQRGAYLVNTMGCDDCHSPKKFGPHGPEVDTNLRFGGYPAGRPLPPFDTGTAHKWVLFAGDLTAAVGPWGVSFSANISSDPTGIGNWTEAQFIRCLREGKWLGLDDRPLLPPMPWQNFAKLTDRDLKSIYAFLKTTKPVNNTVPQPIPPGGPVK